MKKEILCPNCGTPIQINEETYESLAKQVRDNEFEEELTKQTASIEAEKEAAIKLAVSNTKLSMKDELANKDATIQKLQAEIEELVKDTSNTIYRRDTMYNQLQVESNNKIAELQKIIDLHNTKCTAEINKAVNEAINKEREKSKNKDIHIAQLIEAAKTNVVKYNATIAKLQSDHDKNVIMLQNEINNLKNAKSLSEKGLKEHYEEKLKVLNEEIEYYKNYKTKLTVKLLGESLEEHCSTEYEGIRHLLPNATFEKDNTVSVESRSKGDFIFREYDTNGIEMISIMFEMKNEADMSTHKHKNEDYLKELDKDRREKNCEYAILVSMLEPESDLYNRGIVDMSHRYEKMYIVRPQFFIPIITLLRGSALNTLRYKIELENLKNQTIDATTIEADLEEYKDAIAKCFEQAAKKKESAIVRIDKAIKLLQDIKDDITKYEHHEELAVKKADKLTIKKLSKKAPSLGLSDSTDIIKTSTIVITNPKDVSEIISESSEHFNNKESYIHESKELVYADTSFSDDNS